MLHILQNSQNIRYLIYGSSAIKYFYSDYTREPNDLDLIINKDIKEKLKLNSHLRIEQYHLSEFEYIFERNKDKLYVDPDFLYSIKLSHLSWDINWTKHMKDVIFLKQKGAALDKELYNNLLNAWSQIHGKKNVKMNVKNEEFFKKNIYRKYNHEFLHEEFSFYERPLNEKIRKDLNSPLCSEELWNNLSYDDKIKCALEEIYVLTAERYIFVDDKLPLNIAKTKTIKNMITSTTSGWFNLFLKENFNELRLFEPNHILMKIKELENN